MPQFICNSKNDGKIIKIYFSENLFKERTLEFELKKGNTQTLITIPFDEKAEERLREAFEWLKANGIITKPSP